MMAKIALKLPKPLPPGDDCLPHAAMNLGAAGGSSMRPMSRMVSSLVLEEQFGNWVLYRLDEHGGFAGDSWHGSKEDALWQIKKEFGIEVTE
jgi:hypothetical protein